MKIGQAIRWAVGFRKTGPARMAWGVFLGAIASDGRFSGPGAENAWTAAPA